MMVTILRSLVLPGLILGLCTTMDPAKAQTLGASLLAKECRLDICFLLDVSSSVLFSNFRYVKSYVSHFVDSFDISIKRTQIGVVTFAESTHVEFHLNQYVDAKSLKRAIDNINYADEVGTNLAAGLAAIRNSCFGTPGDRAAVRNLAILVTDGVPNDPRNAVEQALLTRKAGIELIAVGIGYSVNRTILREIANGDQNVFVYDDFSGLLQDTVQNIRDLSCGIRRACSAESKEGKYPNFCVTLKTPEVVSDVLVRFACFIERDPDDLTNIDDRYDVTWLVDDEKVGETSTLRSTGLPSLYAYLDESSLAGHMGKWLSCAVKSYYQGSKNDAGPEVYSRRHWLGLAISENTIHLRESDKEPYKLYVYNTLPVSCQSVMGGRPVGCELHFRVRSKGSVAVYQTPISQTFGFETDKCHFSQSFPEWRANESVTFNIARPLYVMPTVDEIYREEPRVAEISIEFIAVPQKQFRDKLFESMWNGYVMDKIKVYISDDKPGVCYGWGDPHITPFDSPQTKSFTSQDTGVYSYAKGVTYSDFEIQVMQSKCKRGACSVGCAVAVREEVYVYALDMCGGGFSGPIRKSQPQVPDPSVGIWKKDKNKYQIRTIGGIVVDVEVYSWYLNYWIKLPAKYTSDTVGVCGNFNGNPGDDGTPQDSNPTSVRTAYMNQYKVSASESLFTNLQWDSKTPGVKLENFCDCSKGDDFEGASTDTCGLKSLNVQEVTNEAAWKLARALMPRGIGKGTKKRSARQGRATIRDDVNYDYTPVNIPYSAAENDTPPDWGTLGISLEQAEEACYNHIFGLQSFGICSKIINPNGYNDLINSCLYDIQMTGELSWGSHTGFGLQLQCQRDILASITMRSDEDITALDQLKTRMANFTDTLCDQKCSIHGVCRAGQCVCDEGYMGHDCMATKNDLPILTGYLGPAVCDVKEFLCQSVRIRGSNFLESENLTCRVHVTQESGLEIVFNSKAELFTTDSVICELPDLLEYINTGNPLYEYSVAISNDGGLFVEVPVEKRIVVDTVCMNCVGTSCTQAPRTCVHRGQCYLPGESLPDSDECLVCDPNKSTRSLTNLREKEEQHGVIYSLENVFYDEVQAALVDVQQIVAEVLEEYCASHTEECCSGLNLRPSTQTHEAVYEADNVKIACGFPKPENLTDTSLLLAVEVTLQQVSDTCDIKPGSETDKVFMKQAILINALEDSIPRIQAHFNSSYTEVESATTLTTTTYRIYTTTTSIYTSYASPTIRKGHSLSLWLGFGFAFVLNVVLAV